MIQMKFAQKYFCVYAQIMGQRVFVAISVVLFLGPIQRVLDRVFCVRVHLEYETW